MNTFPAAIAALLLSLAAAYGTPAADTSTAASIPAMQGSAAPDSVNRASDRKALLAMLAGVELALNNRDIATIKQYLHSKVVVTFQDAKVAKGIDALEGYYNEKYGGASAVLKGFSTQAAVDAPAVFSGNIAVAHGHTSDKFVFATGKEFKLESKWTATLRKDDGRWSVMALHFSADLFDNPLLKMATDKLMIVAVAALIVGLLSGAGIVFLLTRKK